MSSGSSVKLGSFSDELSQKDSDTNTKIILPVIVNNHFSQRSTSPKPVNERRLEMGSLSTPSSKRRSDDR